MAFKTPSNRKLSQNTPKTRWWVGFRERQARESIDSAAIPLRVLFKIRQVIRKKIIEPFFVRLLVET